MKTTIKKMASTIVLFVTIVTAQTVFGYYDPSTGRFLSRDPIGEPGFQVLQRAQATSQAGPMPIAQQSTRWITRDASESKGGLNLYGMAGNDVIDRYDSLGLCSCKVTSATLEKLGFVYWYNGFKWYVIGDIKFADRQNCLPVQYQKSKASKNGNPVPTASTGGPLDGRWHVDSSPYVGDDVDPAADLSHATGVDILRNDEHELRYLDEPGWKSGLEQSDAFSLDISLKIIVYDIGSKPPKKVKESNTLHLWASGTWPTINYNGP